MANFMEVEVYARALAHHGFAGIETDPVVRDWYEQVVAWVEESEGDDMYNTRLNMVKDIWPDFNY